MTTSGFCPVYKWSLVEKRTDQSINLKANTTPETSGIPAPARKVGGKAIVTPWHKKEDSKIAVN